LFSVSFPMSPDPLPGVPTRLYEFSRKAAMMPVWLWYMRWSRDIQYPAAIT
jgi:hypothetical protein